MMETSHVSRTNAVERSGSSAGVSCRRNGKTSAVSRPRASTTNGISSACRLAADGYRFRFCSSRSLADRHGLIHHVHCLGVD